jgi:hypothetical protein
MKVSSADFVSVQSVFGSGYVPEQHDEPASNHLAVEVERGLGMPNSNQTAVATAWGLLVGVMALGAAIAAVFK